MPETIDVNPPSRDLGPDTRILHVVYVLHGLAPFTALLLAVVGLIVGFVKRDDVRGTFLENHYSWLSRTFWWGLLWWLLAWGIFWLLTVVTLGIGAVVLWILPAIVFVWYLYRVLRGWLRLNDGQAVD